MNTIYLDNAATSFPKPEAVAQAMVRYLNEVGAPLNRSVYQNAQEAELVTLSLREQLKRFFHFPEKATHVILTPGNTYGLNFLLKGYLHPGDHVIVSSMEHNAVMRPLLQMPEVSFDRLPADTEGFIDPDDIHRLVRPNTKLILINHGSNVSGSVQDAEAVGAIAAQYGIPFALDGAQTAGHFPLDFQRFRLSALSVPGHKGLLGPQGIGGFIIKEDMIGLIDPLLSGGTGSISHTEEIPAFMPDRFEPGTMNLPGIMGLHAGLTWLEETGIDAIRDHELRLTGRMLAGLTKLEGEGLIRIVGRRDLENRTGVVSIQTLTKELSQAAFELDAEHEIQTRVGLHCAPSAHTTLGTYPTGTIRFSFGWFNTEADIDAALHALEEICHGI